MTLNLRVPEDQVHGKTTAHICIYMISWTAGVAG